MVLDTHDTIAAIGSASGPAARGMVRVSGPNSLACVAEAFTAHDSQFRWEALRAPRGVVGTFHTDLTIPCELFVWPTEKSYTRQPTAEIHTLGSTPLLESILKKLCACGARTAEPGEFTLRAFLAGRVDLTQAEAVLGVIDAQGQDELDTALSQLAGGLAQPLSELRDQLLAVLAELEAGLDFVEEDIQFISATELRRQLANAQQTVASIREQVLQRSVLNELPRVVITGPPNVGKSSLFNALIKRYGVHRENSAAIVSDQAGTTRDYLSAPIKLKGVLCELIDTAGTEPVPMESSIDSTAQAATDTQLRQADLQIRCREANETSSSFLDGLLVLTKADRVQQIPMGSSAIACSSLTGNGLSDLGDAIRNQLTGLNHLGAAAVISTAARSAESLRLADESLSRAVQLAQESRGEELIAAEVRTALAELGRVVGDVYTDDLLDRIFGQFCIGK